MVVGNIPKHILLVFLYAGSKVGKISDLLLLFAAAAVVANWRVDCRSWHSRRIYPTLVAIDGGRCFDINFAVRPGYPNKILFLIALTNVWWVIKKGVLLKYIARSVAFLLVSKMIFNECCNNGELLFFADAN